MTVYVIYVPSRGRFIGGTLTKKVWVADIMDALYWISTTDAIRHADYIRIRNYKIYSYES